MTIAALTSGDSFHPVSGSIYSGVKDTTGTWNGQVEKLATGVNIVVVEDQTVQMSIGFTDEPLAEPTAWINFALLDPSYARTLGAYVAWRSVGDGTFKLTQTKAK